MSVGGMVGNRKRFGALLPGVDHIRHTHDLARNAFSTRPAGAWRELADDLERLCALHGADDHRRRDRRAGGGLGRRAAAAARATCERLREICDKHGILLIFDEVITGFGRLGTPFAAERFGVRPDMITMAKGMTNGAVPMGAVFASRNASTTPS